MSLETCLQSRNSQDMSHDSRIGPKEGKLTPKIRTEGGRKRKTIEQYSGYNAPNQRTEIRLLDNADPSDGAGKNVRARNEHQKEHKHHARKLVAKFAPHQAHGIGVVLNMGMLHSDLADNIAGVDGNESDAHSHDNASHHA